MTMYGHTLSQEPPHQGVMKFTILVEASMLIITKQCIFKISEICQGI